MHSRQRIESGHGNFAEYLIDGLKWTVEEANVFYSGAVYCGLPDLLKYLDRRFESVGVPLRPIKYDQIVPDFIKRNNLAMISYCFESGFNPSEDQMEDFIQEAIIKNKVEIATYLEKRGAKIQKVFKRKAIYSYFPFGSLIEKNAYAIKGESVLTYAIYESFDSVAQFLIERYDTSSIRLSEVNMICRSGNLDLIKCLFKYHPVGLNLSELDLTKAIKKGQYEIVEYLFPKGGFIIKDIDTMIALASEVKSNPNPSDLIGDHERVYQFLLNKRAETQKLVNNVHSHQIAMGLAGVIYLGLGYYTILF